MRTRELLCLALAWVGGCSDDFEPSSLVQDLRILAVQADQPFALPGQEVQLRALAHDAEARPLSWGWGLCIAPDSSLALDCLQAVDAQSFASAALGPTYSVRMPETSAPYVGVVVAACPGTLALRPFGGLPVSCLDAAGSPLPPEQFELGVKRIYLREPTLNQNPRISELLWDGEPWPEGEPKTGRCAGDAGPPCVEFVRHTIDLRAPDAAELSVDRLGRQTQEQAVLQFYATGGEFGDDVRSVASPTNSWQARAEDADKLVTLWFVLRDDRGGVTWTTRQLQIPALR